MGTKLDQQGMYVRQTKIEDDVTWNKEKRTFLSPQRPVWRETAMVLPKMPLRLATYGKLEKQTGGWASLQGPLTVLT